MANYILGVVFNTTGTELENTYQFSIPPVSFEIGVLHKTVSIIGDSDVIVGGAGISQYLVSTIKGKSEGIFNGYTLTALLGHTTIRAASQGKCTGGLTSPL